MAVHRTIALADDTLGLIVRGKLTADHEPDLFQQHADCILPNGAPIRYFREGNEAKLNSIGLNMQGVVSEYDAMRVRRPFYIQIDAAVTYREYQRCCWSRCPVLRRSGSTPIGTN